MSFSELGVGDAFMLRWWYDDGPNPRIYVVVDRYVAENCGKDETFFSIVRLDATRKGTHHVSLNGLESACETGDVQLVDVICP